jgi:2-methylaconitate cis-trans-isomerase PrpF
MCLAVAANLPGSLVHRLTRPEKMRAAAEIRLGTPSGAIPIGAVVGADGTVERVTTYRTARRLMEGRVLVPEA